VADALHGPAIFGALQTSRSVAVDADGRMSLEGAELRLRAENEIRLEVGNAQLRLDKTGAVRVEGERMVIDMSALVRFLSNLVELP
jgi:hypothetical protein